MLTLNHIKELLQSELKPIKETLSEHTRKLDKLAQTVDEHSGKLDRLTETVEEHSGKLDAILVDINQLQEDQKANLDEFQDLHALKKQIAKSKRPLD